MAYSLKFAPSKLVAAIDQLSLTLLGWASGIMPIIRFSRNLKPTAAFFMMCMDVIGVRQVSFDV
ncbi:hypothetical protein X730_12010 [Mesorhizobium sp. L103C565B0]|nr:hypothetical protein X730_12010 [Mesorhizobium sp. L103C565B0]